MLRAKALSNEKGAPDLPQHALDIVGTRVRGDERGAAAEPRAEDPLEARVDELREAERPVVYRAEPHALALRV